MLRTPNTTTFTTKEHVENNYSAELQRRLRRVRTYLAAMNIDESRFVRRGNRGDDLLMCVEIRKFVDEHKRAQGSEEILKDLEFLIDFFFFKNQIYQITNHKFHTDTESLLNLLNKIPIVDALLVGQLHGFLKQQTPNERQLAALFYILLNKGDWESFDTRSYGQMVAMLLSQLHLHNELVKEIALVIEKQMKPASMDEAVLRGFKRISDGY